MTFLAFLRLIFGLESFGQSSAIMKPSADCLALVKHFEGYFSESYRCPAGVWTIGYGHTGLTHKDGTVKAGRRVTEAQADALLAHDLAAFADRVNRLVTVPLTQHQFDALVSFDFNTGGLAKSTLLRKLNAGNYSAVPAELGKWDKAGGQRLRGLTRRRASEANLWAGKRPFIVPA